MTISKVIHVGLPKTGSTAIQHLFFSKSREFKYFSVSGNCCEIERQKELDGLFFRIINYDDMVFDYENERQALLSILEGDGARSSNILVSLEGFTGRFGVGIGVKAQRLKKLLPDYKIFLVVRRPLDLLRSGFIQNLANLDRRPFIGSFPRSLEEYVEEAMRDPFHPLSPITSIRFHKIADLYKRLFGKENVKLMPYEKLRKEPDKFISELAAFLGADPESSARLFAKGNREMNTRRQSYVIMDQQLSKWPGVWRLPSGIRQPVAQWGARIMNLDEKHSRLSRSLEDRVTAVAAEECSALEDEWNLGLADYGYPL